MTNIVDPRAIKFSNEQIRPASEKIRALVAELSSIQTDWFSGINTLFTNDDSLVDDGRENEGISRLTGADINNVMSIVGNLAAASNAEIIAKPCIRPLTAE